MSELSSNTYWKYSPNADDGGPPFDAAFAAQLIGKYILVGVTVKDRNGTLKHHEQFHGVVTVADPVAGIQVELRGIRNGEKKALPPHTGAFQLAEKGSYSLRSTGEVVIDPDYTSTWILTQAL